MSSKRARSDPGSWTGGKRQLKEREVAELNPLLSEAKEQVREAWSRGLEYSHEKGLILDTQPFAHCVIPNFVQSQRFLAGLQNELLRLNFYDKSNDLYKFKQSDDLRKKKEYHISALRKVLFEDFRTWLSDIIGIKLENTVDLSCAKYEYTDVLLCHDDELEGRRIAFILYLVPEWGKCDGGNLDLYGADDHYQPQQIVKSLTPSWNTLVFFEVSPVSHHQVSEVLSEEKCRLSVSGWFHGPSLERPARYIEPLSHRYPHIASDEKILYDWINPIYLDVSTQAHIQEEFEEESEILLKNFFKKETFQMVCKALQGSEIKWKRRGPANKRCYDQAEEDSLPDILAKCMELFSSEAMFLLLSNFTGLKLHFLAASNNDADEKDSEIEEHDGHEHPCSSIEKRNKCDSTERKDDTNEGEDVKPKKIEDPGESSKNPNVPVCRGELRYWRNGYYTLIHDTNVENSEFALDLLLYCGCEGWNEEFGGVTSYIAKGEDEELLSLCPEDNSLALIYRDKETLKFVKHINQRSISQCKKTHETKGFWDFNFVYYE
ncbi:prolyl 3-hydroxylase OGFOD1 isoform X1 [Hemiscyllium ocellatum]|uniref:prolyl 3-hydroxylase OGFOD1 isoform X1 n=1 Tax=Hemiscyllium ocellatum TaxID=170820 RepID=UPI0029665178|nr:prolyl 3-hydroxylase OGFOD1 isoform X1 [Hemiscyllium ocellatum]